MPSSAALPGISVGNWPGSGAARTQTTVPMWDIGVISGGLT